MCSASWSEMRGVASFQTNIRQAASRVCSLMEKRSWSSASVEWAAARISAWRSLCSSAGVFLLFLFVSISSSSRAMASAPSCIKVFLMKFLYVIFSELSFFAASLADSALKSSSLKKVVLLSSAQLRRKPAMQGEFHHPNWWVLDSPTRHQLGWVDTARLQRHKTQNSMVEYGVAVRVQAQKNSAGKVTLKITFTLKSRIQQKHVTIIQQLVPL